MRYCPDCGSPHECEGQETGREKAEVAIARLHTQRDIEVARINASAGVSIAETEAEHATEHAEGVVEGIETVMDAMTGEDEPEAGEPIVVETEPVTEAELEPGLDAPPPPEIPETGAPAGNKSSWWSGYR